MEGHSAETALSPAQTVMSTGLQSSAQGSLIAMTRDKTRTTPAFLSNLGKPTLRGIRKCPHCGIYNGTRGLSCKNKACGAIFRDGAAPGARRSARKGSGGGWEVVRIGTDVGTDAAGRDVFGDGGIPPSSASPSSPAGTPQVFSVRQRGRGPEQRGFVELTLTDTTIATTDGTLLTRLSLGRCFLPACRRQQQHQQRPRVGTASSPSSSSRAPDPLCSHVRQAMEASTCSGAAAFVAMATPLLLKPSVLEGLSMPHQSREELLCLANPSTSGPPSPPGPLVQRVTPHTLAVKCSKSESHPLGLLHCFLAGGGPKGTESTSGGSFRCACHQLPAGGTGGSGGVPGRDKGVMVGKSVASSEGDTMTKEKEVPSMNTPPSGTAGGSDGGSAGGSSWRCVHYYACVWAIASDERMTAEFPHFLHHNSNEIQLSGVTTGLCTSDGQPSSEPIGPHKGKRLKVDEPITVAPQQQQHPLDESLVSLSFQHWLASVNEKINQVMHYQFSGKPEPLVFHIPQSFFNALQQRLSLGRRKRRLPTATTVFVRQDTLPLGSFSKYTWHITSLMQLKHIFDTPELPLKLRQSFVRNPDGSYWPISSPDSAPTEPQEPLSRPLGIHTFLKVGMCSPGQKDPTPFVIEWIPDILPRSQVGELRLHFEYGHQPPSQSEH